MVHKIVVNVKNIEQINIILWHTKDLQLLGATTLLSNIQNIFEDFLTKILLLGKKELKRSLRNSWPTLGIGETIKPKYRILREMFHSKQITDLQNDFAIQLWCVVVYISAFIIQS